MRSRGLLPSPAMGVVVFEVPDRRRGVWGEGTSSSFTSRSLAISYLTSHCYRTPTLWPAGMPDGRLGHS